MKFTAIRLNNGSSEAIELPIVNASASDPYILKSADGLGPPEVDVFISQTMNMDGYYKGRQVQYREIVLMIGLNSNYRESILASDLRAELYGLLSPGYSDAMQVTIVNDDSDIMYTTGYVKKLEIVPFSVSPEVQLTIACLKSCFEAVDAIYVELDQSHPDWQGINNEGTAETGIFFQVEILYDTVGFTIQDNRAKVMSFNYEFLAGDILSVDTRPGSRSITLERDGGTDSILYALSMQSEWFWLYGGYNELRSADSTYFKWLEIYYVPQYWGI